jgi:hypothetical protein
MAAREAQVSQRSLQRAAKPLMRPHLSLRQAAATRRPAPDRYERMAEHQRRAPVQSPKVQPAPGWPSLRQGPCLRPLKVSAARAFARGSLPVVEVDAAAVRRRSSEPQYLPASPERLSGPWFAAARLNSSASANARAPEAGSPSLRTKPHRLEPHRPEPLAVTVFPTVRRSDRKPQL